MSYEALVKAISSGIQQFQWQDAVDIFIIFILLYNIIVLTKGTRAYQVLKGVAVLFIASAVSQVLGLTALSWMLQAVISSGIIVAVILFQPELRRALEHIGRGKLFEKAGSTVSGTSRDAIIAELKDAFLALSRRRIGALVVFERRTGLEDIVATGTRIGGAISSALIQNIFEPNTPLHDGAVIIRDDTVLAAGCFLPLSDESAISRELGTRHRAALGVSSVSDSVTVVVSEETGVISYASESRIVRYLDEKSLQELLESLYTGNNLSFLPWLNRRGKNEGER